MRRILEQFGFDPSYKRFIEGVRLGRIPASLSGMCASSRPFFVAAALCDLGKKGVVVLPEEKDVQEYAAVLRLFFDRVLIYPARDFVFENVSAYSREWEHERLSVLSKAANGAYDVILTVPDALMQYTVPREVLSASGFSLERGGIASLSEVCSRLEAMGYTRTDTVEGAGQYASRGGIVDIFSPNYDYPVRVDLFGDEVDLIGFFDVVSQRRIENLERIEIIPCSEIVLSDNSKEAISREINSLIKKLEPGDKKRVARLLKRFPALNNRYPYLLKMIENRIPQEKFNASSDNQEYLYSDWLSSSFIFPSVLAD
ncbi:MAG: hypothetical protein J5793_05695, partial [Clostridia bacterium]|nr:hypothetical protein [Clostridia bacterium]